MPGIISVEHHSGRPIRTGGVTLVPFSQALCIHLPGWTGGFVWNRPESVLVIQADGQEQVLPIQDVTRQIVWSVLGATAVVAYLLWLKDLGRKGQNSGAR